MFARHSLYVSGNTVLGTTPETRPAEFARASLSALGSQTPLSAFSCTCNVDFQDISCADGLCCYYGVCHANCRGEHCSPDNPFSKVLPRVTLLFFFTEKKKRSKKRKAFRLSFYEKATYHTTGSVTPQSSLRLASSSAEEPYIEISSFLNKNPPEGS